jgi:homoserine kinase type II
LAQMHNASEKIKTITPNHFGMNKWDFWNSSIGNGMNSIDVGLYDLVDKELSYLKKIWPSDLPLGQIHADYFPDNVFFDQGVLTGVIDFHFVCHDMFVYDLAIAINAWSFDEHNIFMEDRMMAMINGYQLSRKLTAGEKQSLPVMLRAASLRFLLSRIEEKLKWREGDFMTPHDPMVFERRLNHFQNYSVSV